MQEILLIGFYQPDEALTRFLEAAQQEFNLPVRSGQVFVCMCCVGTGEQCPRHLSSQEWVEPALPEVTLTHWEVSEFLCILSFSVGLGQACPGNRRGQCPDSWYLTPLISLSWLWGLWGQVPTGICPSGHRRWSLPLPGSDPGWGP